MPEAYNTNSVPEPGQLVQVRRLHYAVSNVRQTNLSEATLGQKRRGKHLVTLACIEDETLGEEAEVFWELEIAAKVYEVRQMPYPEKFDAPEKLEAFLDAVRWGAISGIDTRNVQSPFRSGIEIEDYQLDPVMRAVQMPRVNLLIADDVGLGKTIEAGLVAQELTIRQKARSVLIVCPSALQIQWQEQMRDKFGLDFKIVDHGFMKWLRRKRGIHVNPWTHFPRLITSIDYLKRERPLRKIKSALPKPGESIYPRRFDLMIVDEAHNIAPCGGGNYAIDSKRTQAIRALVPHFEHKLFLTATPHNGYPESFTALLELLDSQRFARGVTPDRRQLEMVMVRRLKRELPPKWDGSPRFPDRQLLPITVAYTEIEKQAHAWLGEYSQIRRKAMEKSVEATAMEFVLKLLKKRLFSSPAAFLTTLEQHCQSLESKKQGPPAYLSRPTLGILQRQIEEVDEEFADDETYEICTNEAIANTSSLFPELSAREIQLLTQLNNWAETAVDKPDTKAEALLNWINHHIRVEGKWTQERVIIFTEYRATQKWLYELLASQDLVQAERLMTLYGGMNSQEREKIKAAFQASPDLAPVRILLATDAASEGLDLQNHCANLIHYEIPWNPNRLEQRNGRIDRHGQKSPQVKIYHFVSEGYSLSSQKSFSRPGDLGGDLEFLMRAVLKINNIREDLGKVGPVIASQVEEAMLGKRLFLETSDAEKESEPIRRLLKFERKIKDQIQRLKDQLQETRQSLHLTPEHIRRVVEVALEFANQPPLKSVPDQPGVYYLPNLQGTWTVCSRGLAHPHTGKDRPVVFDPDLAVGRDDRVLIHLNHRLAQMSLKLLRTEIWTRQGEEAIIHNLQRVSGRIVPGRNLESPAVITHGRLLVLGGDYQRLHEEVITAGGIFKEGKYQPLGVQEIERLLEVATLEPLPPAIQSKLVDLWDVYHDPLLQGLEKRRRERYKSLERSLANLCEEEVQKISSILHELEGAILREIEESHQPKQLELFSATEKEQFERNRNSLMARLKSIPGEIEAETRLIRQKFANPTARLFPLAITYLFPQQLL